MQITQQSVMDMFDRDANYLMGVFDLGTPLHVALGTNILLVEDAGGNGFVAIMERWFAGRRVKFIKLGAMTAYESFYDLHLPVKFEKALQLLIETDNHNKLADGFKVSYRGNQRV